MKTILFLSPTGTLENGAEISVFTLQKRLTSLGYNVINVCPTGDNKKYIEKHRRSGITVCPMVASKWWWEDAPGPLCGDERTRAYYYRDNIARIREIIRSAGVDVVVTNTVNMFQGAVAAACEGSSHFWLIHEFPQNEFAYYRSKIDFIDEFADELFCVAGALNKELSPMFPNREIKKFIPFTDIGAVEHAHASVSRIVSVGRITERKNQMELLAAYRQLGQPDVELVFIGDFDKDHKKKCDDYIEKNSLKNVTFVKSLDNPWRYLTDKDLFVSTSKMETFGLVYVEALLNGIPAIVSDNPGYAYVHQLFETGRLYPLGNIDELARLMAESLDNFDRLKKESLSSVAKIQERYSVDAAYQEIIQAIEQNKPVTEKSIRHLSNLVTLNENHWGLNGLKARIKRRLYHLFNNKATK